MIYCKICEVFSPREEMTTIELIHKRQPRTHQICNKCYDARHVGEDEPLYYVKIKRRAAAFSEHFRKIKHLKDK